MITFHVPGLPCRPRRSRSPSATGPAVVAEVVPAFRPPRATRRHQQRQCKNQFVHPPQPARNPPGRQALSPALSPAQQFSFPQRSPGRFRGCATMPNQNCCPRQGMSGSAEKFSGGPKLKSAARQERLNLAVPAPLFHPVYVKAWSPSQPAEKYSKVGLSRIWSDLVGSPASVGPLPAPNAFGAAARPDISPPSPRSSKNHFFGAIKCNLPQPLHRLRLLPWPSHAGFNQLQPASFRPGCSG